MLLKLKKNMKEMAWYFEGLGGKGTTMSSQEQPRPGFTEYSQMMEDKMSKLFEYLRKGDFENYYN